MCQGRIFDDRWADSEISLCQGRVHARAPFGVREKTSLTLHQKTLSDQSGTD
jgi:hypothetical protein